MDKENEFIIWFKDLTIGDVGKVGGKNAALGEMVAKLVPLGVNVPNGFAITSSAYNYFIDESGLRPQIESALSGLDVHDIKDLQNRGENVRTLILNASFPEKLSSTIKTAYHELEEMYPGSTDVAVRSSATAEDLPGASFAGQQETFLNITGADAVIEASKKCMASLFTNRAISYREDKGFSHFDISLSVGIQKMVRSDLAASGVMFTIDTETGFDKVVVVNSIFGLGELIVQGKVIPDEFTVFKPTFKDGFDAIIAKDIGKKDLKMIYADNGTQTIPIDPVDQTKYSLTDDEVRTLADWGIKIEDHFSATHKRYQPMDIEWAKDGQTGELFIVQARPETVHSAQDEKLYLEYKLKQTSDKLVEGIAVGKKIGAGKVHVIKDAKEIDQFNKGEVLVTEITDPDWEPIMKIASAIVTDKGGRTSHAAIVSRELGIPCIVGTETATTDLKNDQSITIDCSSGKNGVVYSGILEFETIEHHLDKIPAIKTKLMTNIGSPEEAFKNHFLPVQGVGLGRLEFIISSHIQIHPKALIQYDDLKKSISDPDTQALIAKIDQITVGYEDKAQYYVDELAEGIAKIGAAFWPHDVIIRFSDFKTNEYATLLGGSLFEPKEANPMIGWRGASRYYHEDFKDAFGLECKAIKKVREVMGLKNVVVMVPFCRTVEEGSKVIEIMKANGLDRGLDSTLRVYVMCEIPSNIELADEFLEIFDGMSIGSNDLAQLTLGLDRDSDIVQHIANENNPAVKKLITRVIATCKKHNKYIGICGQAPSDFPEFTEFLIANAIESISVTPDTVIKTLELIAEKEKN